MKPLRLVVLGLSVTSSFGNGHATTFRGLLKAFERRGHSILFLERDLPLYRGRRDLPDPPFCDVELYADVAGLERFDDALAAADVVLVGSYVKEGPKAIDHVLETTDAPVLFYDIDTPITTTLLERGECPYLRGDQIPRFAAYLSFTGGPLLDWIEENFHARRTRPLYCAVDLEVHHDRREAHPVYDLGYLGTYSEDRQPPLESLLLEPARRLPDHRFVVAGPQYPEDIDWPRNVERREHVPPDEHAAFYTAQRFTLNVTREAMRRWGYSPSVRLFEAAACGTPIISDEWNGLDSFFDPGEEILTASGPDEVVHLLHTIDEDRRKAIGEAAHRRVLRDHTATARAEALEGYIQECMEDGSGAAASGPVRNADHAAPETEATRPPHRPPPKTTPARQETEDDPLERLGPWFHNIHLPDGRQTAPDHPLGDFPGYKWAVVARMLPDDLSGSHVLDIGCNGGYYTVEAARRGAHVTALDMDPRYLEQTRWVAKQFGVEDRITLRHAQVYGLAAEKTVYDHVLFLGVLYHLRYPLLALDMVRERVGDRLILQTLQKPETRPDPGSGPKGPGADPTAAPPTDPGYQGLDALQDPDWPQMAFVEGGLAGDPTNWWVPDPACVAAMLRSSGFTIVENDGDIWSARPDPDRGMLRSWNRSELEAVLQGEWKENLTEKVTPREGTLETTRAGGGQG